MSVSAASSVSSSPQTTQDFAPEPQKAQTREERQQLRDLEGYNLRLFQELNFRYLVDPLPEDTALARSFLKRLATLLARQESFTTWRIRSVGLSEYVIAQANKFEAELKNHINAEKGKISEQIPVEGLEEARGCVRLALKVGLGYQQTRGTLSKALNQGAITFQYIYTSHISELECDFHAGRIIIRDPADDFKRAELFYERIMFGLFIFSKQENWDEIHKIFKKGVSALCWTTSDRFVENPVKDPAIFENMLTRHDFSHLAKEKQNLCEALVKGREAIVTNVKAELERAQISKTAGAFEKIKCLFSGKIEDVWSAAVKESFSMPIQDLGCKALVPKDRRETKE